MSRRAAFNNILAAIASNQNRFDAYCINLDGQSNCQGKSEKELIPSPYNALQPNNYILGYGANPNGTNPKEILEFTQLQPVTALGDFAGVELSFAYDLSLIVGKPVFVVKTAQDATGFGNNNTGEWSPLGALRQKSIDNINIAKAYFEDNNLNVYWHSHWDQWEKDALSSSASTNYASYWDIMYQNKIAKTGITFHSHTFQKPNVNSLFYTLQPVNAAKIEEAINGFVETYTNTTIMDNDDQPFKADDVHYGAVANTIRGQRLAATFNV